MGLSNTSDLFKVGVPDIEDEDDNDDDIEVNGDRSDDVFSNSASGFSRSGASTATVVPREKPRRMADLFDKIMGEAAAIKGIAMPTLPPASISDDMQGECFRTQSSSRRVHRSGWGPLDTEGSGKGL